MKYSNIDGQKLKRLNYSSAYYNDHELLSYTTTIVYRTERHIYFRNYHSRTTRLHIRSYIAKLDNKPLALLIQKLYDMTRSKELFHNKYAVIMAIDKQEQMVLATDRDYSVYEFIHRINKGLPL